MYEPSRLDDAWLGAPTGAPQDVVADRGPVRCAGPASEHPWHLGPAHARALADPAIAQALGCHDSHGGIPQGGGRPGLSGLGRAGTRKARREEGRPG